MVGGQEVISSHTVKTGSFGCGCGDAASVSGQPVVKCPCTALLAQPFHCWPSMGQPPIYAGLSSLFKGPFSGGRMPFDPVLWGMGPCLYTDRVDVQDAEAGLLAPVLQHSVSL